MPLDLPFCVSVSIPAGVPERYDRHTIRRLADMPGAYLDEAGRAAMLARENAVVYDVYEFLRPARAGDLLSGVTVLHPGRVGDEFFMTKGHFHAELETAEVYYCLGGRGMMVLQTPEGDCRTLPFSAGQMMYVPPRWAHRSVNTDLEADLVFLFVYPANSGHDYQAIEGWGFAELVLANEGGDAVVVPNPRWNLGSDA